MVLKDNEAQKYYGGGKVAVVIGAAIAAIGTFILGFIDGYTNPKSCNAR